MVGFLPWRRRIPCRARHARLYAAGWRRLPGSRCRLGCRQQPQPLGNLRPGSASSSGEILGPSPRAGETPFIADDGIHGLEPWATDDKPAGTRMLADMTPGSAYCSALALLSAAGLALLRVNFGVGTTHELWVTNGTSAWTSLRRHVRVPHAPGARQRRRGGGNRGRSCWRG